MRIAMSDHNTIGGVNRQSGAVLAISLIMLLLLTVIGVASMGNSGLEEKMAGNLRDRNLAFQAAETALRAGEEQTKSLVCPVLAAVGGFYPYQDIPQINADSFWLDSPPKTYTYAGINLANTTSTAQPKYIIQCLPDSGGMYYYRITARGTGGTTDAVVILQSIYMR
jgi:type IV pilus assembly protein PilX